MDIFVGDVTLILGKDVFNDGNKLLTMGGRTPNFGAGIAAAV